MRENTARVLYDDVMTQEELDHLQKKVRKSSKKAKIGSRIGICFVCFMLAMVALYRFSIINEQCNEIDKLEKQLFLLQAENKQEKLKLEQNLDLKNIEQVATEKLGMQKPAKNQVVVVQVQSVDSAQVVNQEEEKKGFLGLLTSCFANIVEYLD